MQITLSQLGLINGLVAVINKNDEHSVDNLKKKVIDSSDEGLLFEVTQYGPYGKRKRALVVRDAQTLETYLVIEVCPQPEFVNRDNRPDFDPDDGPGTPIALAA
jgi:regulator of extracellular matrix RemA (YlzA/DUF370 family)